MHLSRKVKNFIWFIKRPALYPELFRTVVRKTRKLFGSNGTDKDVVDIAWYETYLYSTEEALHKLTGMAPGLTLNELYPSEMQFAKLAMKQCPVKMGGGGHIDLLYYLILYSGSKNVIETGVAYGWSSLAILLALKDQPDGILISTDLPYGGRDNDAFVGCVVPKELGKNWKILRQADREALPKALRKMRSIHLCHYDSDKSYKERMWAYHKLWQALTTGGYLVSDDVGDNDAFRDFAIRSGADPVILKLPRSGGRWKYIGILSKH